MVYLLAALLVVLIVKDVWVSRRRDTENQDWRALLAAEREAHREMVNVLCQRIQAPEQAVIEHAAMGAQSMPKPVPPDDDDEYWRAQAEQSEDVAEALGRMRQLEAEAEQAREFEARIA